MKTALRAILSWLDRKFPDMVVVTQAQYDGLERRIKYLEGEVTKFNMSLGFGGVPVRPGADGQPARQPFTR